MKIYTRTALCTKLLQWPKCMTNDDWALTRWQFYIHAVLATTCSLQPAYVIRTPWPQYRHFSYTLHCEIKWTAAHASLRHCLKLSTSSILFPEIEHWNQVIESHLVKLRRILATLQGHPKLQALMQLHIDHRITPATSAGIDRAFSLTAMICMHCDRRKRLIDKDEKGPFIL